MNRTRCIALMITIVCTAISAAAGDFLRGVVYDTGLRYGGSGELSVTDFNPEQVRYDMGIISNILRCNAVRVEGEDIGRLCIAAESAHAEGLKVFFNPWKMGADAATTEAYMADAAKAARKLKDKGVDLVFVAGCEYTLFSKGAFPGETFDDRFQWLMSLGQGTLDTDEIMRLMAECNSRLNRILADICSAVRAEFNGPLTYSSGTWEQVDWNLFDIIALDHYRHNESDDEYLAIVKNLSGEKPVLVLETGCCTYQGASKRGGEAFAILQGVDADGNGIYEGGTVPVRSEKEQADYIYNQVKLLAGCPEADGVFIFVFSYPVYPYSKEGVDLDMTSYALVKTFRNTDSLSRKMPAWQPKEAFYRLGELYTRIAESGR